LEPWSIPRALESSPVALEPNFRGIEAHFTAIEAYTVATKAIHRALLWCPGYYPGVLEARPVMFPYRLGFSLKKLDDAKYLMLRPL
jgi:hypothetical protein